MSEEQQKTPEQQERDELRSLALGESTAPAGRTVEWKGRKFEMRRLTLAQQKRLTKLAQDGKGVDDIKLLVHTVIESVHTPSGLRVFSAADEARFMEKDSGPDSIIKAFMKAAREMAEDEADIEKNSEAAPTDS